jgi:50S ribosomal subunit-associated GTPase HflX
MWHEMVRQALPLIDKIYVAMNKIDLDPAHDTAEVRAWAEAHGCKFFVTSAKDAQSVGHMFVEIAEAVAAANDRPNPHAPSTQEIVEKPEREGKCCRG